MANLHSCATLILLAASSLLAQDAAESASVGAAAGEPDQGKTLFDAHCARCHGVGGTGGEGPSLTRPTLRRAADDESLLELIRGGIPAAGMPGAWMLGSDEAASLAAYVRSLGAVEMVPLAGDPTAGKRVYDEQGCEACHILGGLGRGLGPELTVIGALRGAEHLRRELVDPSAWVSEDYLLLRLRTREGAVVRGLRVNEDAFTIQVRDENNRFHSFDKTELEELRRQPRQTLMPAYRTRLSATEIDDLLAYLANLRGPEPKGDGP